MRTFLLRGKNLLSLSNAADGKESNTIGYLLREVGRGKWQLIPRVRNVSSFIFSAGVLRHFMSLSSRFYVPPLFIILQIMCRVGELISEQAYIFKKQRFIEVFEREIEDRRGMSWLSLVLILGGLNDLFNLLLFLAEIFFTSSVTLHHSTSLIFHRGFPAVPYGPPHFLFPAILAPLHFGLPCFY